MLRVSAPAPSPQTIDRPTTLSRETTLEAFKNTCKFTLQTPSQQHDKTTQVLSSALSNEQLATRSASCVRLAYKSGLGSYNKCYPSTEIAEARISRKNTTSLRAATTVDKVLELRVAVNALRSKITADAKSGITYPNGPVLNMDAGNCGELSKAAAKTAHAYGGYAEVWHFQKADHAFAVIGHPPEENTVDFKTWKDVWIVDPWTNITCEATDYMQALTEKLKKWHHDGKFIVSSVKDGFWACPPINYIDGFKNCTKAPYIVPTEQMPNPWKNFSFSLADKPEKTPNTP